MNPARGPDGRGTVTGALAALFGTATFRLTIGSTAILLAVTLLQFSLIYWRITAFEVDRADRLLDREAALMAAQSPADLLDQLRLWQTNDLRLLITAAGLFDADRRPLGGNLVEWPENLPVDGAIREITVHPLDQGPRTIRAEALPVHGGRFLVIGRGLRDLQQLREITLAAIETALIPALLVSLGAGAWLGRRNLARVGRMQRAIDAIMEGGLHERLPVGRSGDEMARLASSVNRMLERLEHLLDEMRGVGDDIAHDLRTPLARVRAGLDRARLRTRDPDALLGAVDRAITDLDQCFGIITALLRLGELENDRRRGHFGAVSLRELVSEIIELYEPLAEEAGQALLVTAMADLHVSGDRELLFELAANLVDNAIKFTPRGGQVSLAVLQRPNRQAVLRVSDTGIGIPIAERGMVMQRFFRSDKSRHIGGSGLGLSLVAAIARLHEATVQIGGGPGETGTVFEIGFPAPPEP